MTPAIEFCGITKRFPGGFLALDDVSLQFYRGELHAVVGENGAGKSTLMNIMFGLLRPTGGRILADGKPRIHRKPADAIAGGIGMVHQHFKLVPTFTVAENLRLVARPEMRHKIRNDKAIIALAEQYGITINPGAIAGTLPLALQQRVEILKTLVNEADLLILDEPTTILNPKEADSLYEVLARMVADQRAVVVVTHHLDEVLNHSQRVSVIRHGRLIGSGPTEHTDRAALVAKIVGKTVELDRPFAARTQPPGAEELRLDAVSLPGSAFSAGLHEVSLSLRGGEIVAIAGVEGNGQREIFDILSGLQRPATGKIWARHADSHNRPIVGLVPEDRHAEGLVLDLSVALNIVFDHLGTAPYARAGRLHHGAINARAAALTKQFDVRTRGIDAAAATLSGGNQQKIVIARALNGGANVLIVYQPTRGLDIAASEEVRARLYKAAGDGAAVLLISSNLDEIMQISDRILVLYEGRVTGEVANHAASAAQLGHWMTGGTERAA